MTRLKDRTALVTGAAGGIGQGTALALADRGCNVALADIDEDGLHATQTLMPPGVRVSRHRLDVADHAAILALPVAIGAAHGGLDILVNNAGVALGGLFEDVSEEDFEWLIEVNLWGVVRMTRAFLPLLRESPDARIVNVSSVYGLIAPPPGQVAYATSKFAVRGFTEALRSELAETRIGVSCVHPGGVATRIADRARLPRGVTDEEARTGREAMKRLLKLPPKVAGEIIVRGIERDRDRILVGSDARVIWWLERLLPNAYAPVLRKVAGPRP